MFINILLYAKSLKVKNLLIINFYDIHQDPEQTLLINRYLNIFPLNLNQESYITTWKLLIEM